MTITFGQIKSSEKYKCTLELAHNKDFKGQCLIEVHAFATHFYGPDTKCQPLPMEGTLEFQSSKVTIEIFRPTKISRKNIYISMNQDC